MKRTENFKKMLWGQYVFTAWLLRERKGNNYKSFENNKILCNNY